MNLPQRAFNSPCIEYANFTDGTYVNLIRLIKPYSNGVSFAVFSVTPPECGLFKTEIRAKERFNKIVKNRDVLKHGVIDHSKGYPNNVKIIFEK